MHPFLRRFGDSFRGERNVHRKVLGASVAGVLVIVALAVMFLVATHESAALDHLRRTSLDSMRITASIENDLGIMETAHRGFLIAGEETLRVQFEQTRAALNSRLDVLRGIVAKEPTASVALNRFGENFRQWEQQFVLPQIRAQIDQKDVTQLAGYTKGKDWLAATRVSLQSFHEQARRTLDQANARTTLQIGGFSALCLLTICLFLGSNWYSFDAFRRHLKKVESAEAQTRVIVDSTLDGVITIDDTGSIESVNPAAEQMFGWSAAQLLQQNISRIIPQRLFNDDRTPPAEGTVTAIGQREGGHTFPIEISISDMHTDRAPGFVLIVRDIAERKRGEETLKHIGLGLSSATGEEFVKSLVQELSRALQTDFAFIIELHRKGERLSSTLTLAERGEMHTCAPFELAGSACGEVLQSGFRAYLGGAQARFPEDGLLTGLEVESFVAMPLVDHNGQAVGVMGVLHHQSLEVVQVIEATLQIFAARAGAEIERKRFEEDLAEEKERLAVTLRSIGDGFITTDNAGRVLMLNNVSERLTGWSQESAAGHPLPEVLCLRHERSRRPLHDVLMSIVAEGSAEALSGAAIVIARDGTERVIETNASPIRDSANEKVGVVLVFRDVTERLRAEDERRKNEKLESLGVAAGGIAHDFNNLLTAILGNVSIALMSAKAGEQMTERLVAAKKASVRAQELALQLLTFAKGGSPIKKTSSIGQLVRDTVSFSLRGSNVRSDFNIPDDLWPADVDQGQISQVIQNLTINADQAMPAGGMLRVECGNLELASDNSRLRLKAGRYLRITVRDQGIGIPEENVKKIYDPYFTTKPKGSGLGLATTYSIVKNHGGMIEVASQPGEGTTFYIFLPASDKPLMVVETPKPEVPTPSTGGRVLVLDDEDAICALVTCALEPLGYEVAEAYDSLTAIRLYEEAFKAGRRFDVVISDLTIPGSMGGVEALKRLREIDPQVRAIVSSGYAMDPIMADFRKHGFCGMIAKPYEIDALGHAVATAISGPGPDDENVIHLDFTDRKSGAA